MGSTATLNNTGILQTAAQTNITSLGTLTALDVDDINLNAKTITITGDTDDTFSIVTGASGATTLTTVDTAAAAGNFNVVADGQINMTTKDNGQITLNAAIVSIGDDLSTYPMLRIKSTANDAYGGVLQFSKDRGAAAVNGDDIGRIEFNGENDAEQLTGYAKILVEALEVDDTDEAGKMSLQVAESDGTTSGLTTGLLIEGSDNATDGEVNVTIAAGAASTTTVAGDLAVTSDLTVSGDTTTIDTATVNIGDAATVLSTNITSTRSTVNFTTTDTNTNYTSTLNFIKDAANVVDDERLGQLNFIGDNNAGTPEQITYASIKSYAETIADTDEAGRLHLDVTCSEGSTSALQQGMLLTGHGTSNIVDVGLGYGAASTTTIAGTLTMGSTATLNNSGVLQTAAQTNITSVGTLTGLTTSGAIELGHASDTTLARSASGKVTIEGNQIVTAGAVNVASGAQAPVGMQVARRILTQAEMNDLHNTPIEIIPAQGANTIIQVVPGSFCFADRAATNTAGSTFGIGFDGFTENYSLLYSRRFMYNITTDLAFQLNPYRGWQADDAADIVNKKIEAKFFASGCTTDCFTSVDVFVNYYVLDVS
jgi:hypothetical protein